MISHGSDYRPIDRRPVRWSSLIDPLSLQKRGLVHWIPCGRLDVDSRRLTDRRFRPATEVELPTTWLRDSYRGLYGAYVGGIALAKPAPLDVPDPRAASAFFTPRVTAAPLTITFWARHDPFWSTVGIEVWLGSDTDPWSAYYTSLVGTKFSANHAEDVVFAEATVDMTVTLNEWHFCAAIYVSNADRWAYLDGKAGTHNTTALTPTAAKDVLRIGNNGLASGGNLPALNTVLRDIRVYDRALEEGELLEMYRNPYDMFAQYDRDDDYQFFAPPPPAETIVLPAITLATSLYAPAITQPIIATVPAQTITTALHAPTFTVSSPSDLNLDLPALTVTVTARTPASVAPEEEVIVEDARELEPHNFKVRIVDYVGGDDLRISRTYTELPEGVSINKGYLTIKRLATSDDADAILQKQISAAEAVAGQITDASTTGGSIELYFDLTGAETGALTPLVAYHYDVQIVSIAGAIYTCEKGVMVMQQGVTDATS